MADKTIHKVTDADAIVVTVEGGVIQDISNIPLGCVVQVWDFDVDDCDGEELSINEHGDKFILSEWR